MAREYVLHRVRVALGRSVDQTPEPAPPVRLRIPDVDIEMRIAQLFGCVEKLGAKTYRAGSAAEACATVASITQGRSAVASNAPFLRECGATALPGVCTDFIDRERLRAVAVEAGVGITSADYALADTGTLVMFSSQEEARMISLLPPAHIALVPKDRILTGLDELLTLVPDPAARSSSMALITGPSRTADIEQILVRGVHGPGELHLIVI